HHQIIGVAVGKRGDHLHFLAGSFAHTVAISEVSASQAGHDRVFARILDGYAQVTPALIQVECARLEDRLVFARVKIAKLYEIVQQLEQVPVIADQAIHGGYRIDLGLQRLVLGNERRDRLFALARKDFADAFQAEFLYRGTGFGVDPALVWSESIAEIQP